MVVYLQRLVCVHDDGDEEGEDAVDEKGDEAVEVDAGEVPYHVIVRHSCRERHKHVITVHQWVQTLWCRAQFTELEKKKKHWFKAAVQFHHPVPSTDNLLWSSYEESPPPPPPPKKKKNRNLKMLCNVTLHQQVHHHWYNLSVKFFLEDTL